jgi:hypothetical protein
MKSLNFLYMCIFASSKNRRSFLKFPLYKMYTDQPLGPQIVFFNGSFIGNFSREKCRRERGLKLTNYRRLASRRKRNGVQLLDYTSNPLYAFMVYIGRSLYLIYILKDAIMNINKLYIDVHPVCFL